MTRERWNELMENDSLSLTPEEISQKWHWCHEFDGLLVGPDSEEMKYCHCFDENQEHEEGF